MPETPPRFDLWSLLLLREVRGFIRRASFRGAVALFGILYVLGSLFESGMVVLANLPGGYAVEALLASPTGSQPWNYPGVILFAPWGVVSLPFFPTLAMVVVGVGVGLGMTVAALLTIRLVRPAPGDAARTKAVGAVTGLTPAMLSLVTLGACCSTTAVATAGVGLVADASATSVSNLLLNNWYLGVFQIAVVWVSLLGQEMLLSVYGGLYGRGTAAASRTPPSNRRESRWLAAGTLRVLLLSAGLLWSLAMLADWTRTSPSLAGPGQWFSWIVQHQLLALLAIALALFPRGTLLTLGRLGRSVQGRLVRGAIVVGAVSLLLWLPAPLPSWGLDSLADRLLGLGGVAPAWGAIPTVGLPGAVVIVRLALEYGLLASAALFAVGRGSALLRLLGGELPVTPFAVAPREDRDVAVGATPSPGDAVTPATSTGTSGPVRLVTDADGT